MKLRNTTNKYVYKHYSKQEKTIVGWNLDKLDMEYRVRPTDKGGYIEINDAREGWLPLFGANKRGDFAGMLLR
jgi:hypothetical protein